MDEKENLTGRNEVYSHILKAGKRTYFFDVRKTRMGDYYLTITESKKYFSEEGAPLYKKYKLHLYKEDFSKFQEAFDETIRFIIEKKKNESF